MESYEEGLCGAVDLLLSTNHSARLTSDVKTVVAVVVVNYFSANMTCNAVQSILQYTTLPIEIIVVDNSCDADELSRLITMLAPSVRIIPTNKNGGFGFGCNVGARVTNSEYIFFFNPDAKLLEDTIPRLIANFCLDAGIGAIGCQTIDRHNTLQHSGGDFIGIRRSLKHLKHVIYQALSIHSNSIVQQNHGYLEPHKSLIKVDYVTGAALLIRRETFFAVGGFDEDFFMYAEETDLQYRIWRQLGLRSALDTKAIIFHESGGTSASMDSRKLMLESGCIRFIRKHYSFPYLLAYKLATLVGILVETILSARRGRISWKQSGALLSLIFKG